MKSSIEGSFREPSGLFVFAPGATVRTGVILTHGLYTWDEA